MNSDEMEKIEEIIQRNNGVVSESFRSENRCAVRIV
jgi:hypothetical protein